MLKCSRVLVRQRRRKSWGLLYWARSSTAPRIRTSQLTSLTSHRSLWICHPWFAFWLFFSTVTSHCSHLPHFTDISAQVSLITKLRSETIEFAHYTSAHHLYHKTYQSHFSACWTPVPVWRPVLLCGELRMPWAIHAHLHRPWRHCWNNTAHVGKKVLIFQKWRNMLNASSKSTDAVWWIYELRPESDKLSMRNLQSQYFATANTPGRWLHNGH